MSRPLGQSRNQALHAINNILALEKSPALLNEKIHSLELQLMGNAIFDSADGTDVPQQLEDSRAQQLEDSCAQHTRIIDSQHCK
jgi:hypothetical protein